MQKIKPLVKSVREKQIKLKIMEDLNMKTITIKNWAIAKIYEDLLPFLLGNKKYPQKLNWTRYKAGQKFEEAAIRYNTEYRHLLQQYVVKDVNNNLITDSAVNVINPDCLNDIFTREWLTLSNIDVKLQMEEVDEEIFNYDDSKGQYETLKPHELRVLKEILCDTEDYISKFVTEYGVPVEECRIY